MFTGYALRGTIGKFLKGHNLSVRAKRILLSYSALALVCLGFAFSLISSYILGPLIFSVVFYSAYIYFMGNLATSKKTRSLKKRIEESQFRPIAEKLRVLMENEKLYKNPDLNLDTLVLKLGKGRHFLSQLLNDNLQKNFFQYVNEYRIQEACGMLSEQQALSIEAIGYEVGFRSKSALFAAFKKIKGTTPAKYQAGIGTD